MGPQLSESADYVKEVALSVVVSRKYRRSLVMVVLEIEGRCNRLPTLAGDPSQILVVYDTARQPIITLRLDA